MLHTSGRSGWSGFTLIEVLVMLLLVSLLAAAVFPVVTRRVSRDEPVRAAHDLGQIRAAMEAFAGDLGGVHAGGIDHLVTSVRTSDRAIRHDDETLGFTATDSARWDGPYLDGPIGQGATAITGFDVPVRARFTRFDSIHNAPAGVPGFDAGGNGLFVAVRLGVAGRQLTAAQFEAINDIIDGEDEVDGPGANTSWTLGRLRFDNSLVPADSIGYYLAVPLDD